jgi:hypothetical protein
MFITGDISNVLDRGLYLKRECPCSVKIERLEGDVSFNIIQMIARKAMDCLNCSNQNVSVMIQGLNHKISYQEYEEGKEVKKKEIVSSVSMNKNEEIQYHLQNRLVYLQIDVK